MSANISKKEVIISLYESGKSLEVTPLAILLNEHLTEESNGHITAAAIKTRLRSILNLNVHKSTVQRLRHKYLVIEILSFFKQYKIFNIKLLLRV
jgi:hypothetical protein